MLHPNNQNIYRTLFKSHSPSCSYVCSPAKPKDEELDEGRAFTLAKGPNDTCDLSQKDSLCLGRQDFEKLVMSMPKVQLHDHLEGSVRPQTMIEEADRLGIERPAATVAATKDLVSMRPGENLTQFLAKFRPFQFIFHDKQSLERIAYESVEDNFKDGVDYVEIRMNCQKNPDKVPIGEVLDSVLKGMKRGSEDFGIEARFIAAINRRVSEEEAMHFVEEAIKRMDDGVVGVDLAGDESKHPAAKFKKAFARAREAGLKVTVHAGEADGPESIKSALDDLGADRIGHGARMTDDRKLMDRVRDEDIHVEICPHSNVLLNVVKNLQSLHTRELHDHGISVSLNTDDKHMFDVSLADEYMAMAEHQDFSLQELQNMNLRALEHAFIPEADKERLIESFQDEYQELNAQIADQYRSKASG